MTAKHRPPWSYRSVVFDLDGLLLDTEPIFAEVAERLLARRGKQLDLGVLELMMGTPARHALKLFREHHDLNESVEALSTESSILFYEVLGAGAADIMPGAVELLDLLAERRIPRAIATSSSSRYVERILKPLGLLPRFDFILTCDDVVHGKPHPEVYEKAALRFGHAPAEMIVLEDSPAGLCAAKAAGARCVIVPHRRVPRDRLADADAVVPSLAAPGFLQMMGLGRDSP
jgi:HAD superfamily hydrolase (TIGR01509 family)